MTRPPAVRTARHEALLDGVSVGLFAALVLLALATFTDYGTSWDEHDHALYGDDIVSYFASGMSEAAVPDHHQSYGGGYNLSAALFSRLLPHARSTSTHLFTALLGLLGLMGVWRLGRLLGGAAAGLLALVLLATLPAYYGHMFNNPKDLPFAVGYVWVLYYLCRLIREGPGGSPRLWLALGVSIGLGMTVRVGGLLGIAYLVMILGFQWLRSASRERRIEPALRLLGGLSVRGMLVTTLAWVLMILPWPFTHRAPFTAPFASLSSLSAYSFDTRTLFRGRYVPSNPPPWDYLPGYFLVQLPDVLWLCLAVGVLLLLGCLASPRLRRSLWSWRGGCVAFLSFAIVFPVSYAILGRSTIYDGLRHFLFVLPPLCVLAALGAT
ncbi:MAG: glycosyltransferase family 39 protein, partial [Polyangiales bacterium]